MNGNGSATELPCLDVEESLARELAMIISDEHDGNPCGPDLEYDVRMSALLLASRGIPQIEIGRRADGSAILREGSPPNWNDVIARSLELLKESKDIRIVALLVRALVAQKHYLGLAQGLILLRELLARFGSDLHPRPEGDEGDALRRNALREVVDSPELLEAVRNACIAGGKSDVGISLRMFASGESTGQVEKLSGLAAHSPQALRGPSAARAALHELRRLIERSDPPCAEVRFETLETLLNQAEQIIVRQVGTGVASSEGCPTAVAARSELPRSNLMTLCSREDARRALDAVCAYLEAAEPASPAPLLIRRAQRLMSMTFIEMLDDIAPECVPAFEALVGVRRERA